MTPNISSTHIKRMSQNHFFSTNPLGFFDCQVHVSLPEIKYQHVVNWSDNSYKLFKSRRINVFWDTYTYQIRCICTWIPFLFQPNHRWHRKMLHLPLAFLPFRQEFLHRMLPQKHGPFQVRSLLWGQIKGIFIYNI